MLNDLRRTLYPLLKPIFFRLWLLQRGVTMGVRIAAFDAEGRVCLIKHTYTPGWHLPGGGVERGETSLDAALRELAEEAHVSATEALELFAIYHNRRNSARDHVALYITRDCRQETEFKANFEIAEQGFFALDALPVDTSGATRQRLKDISNGQPRDHLW